MSVFRDVDGIYVSNVFLDATVRSALTYKPSPEDIFVVGYPKSGTTWMQYIVYGILNDGAAPENIKEFSRKSPFLEFVGADAVTSMPRPGCIKTHMRFHNVPYSEKTKYICISRNPYDTCVSFYYHTTRYPAYQFESGTFESFFELFVRGKVDFGDYFDHLLSWYQHRHDPNIFYVTYEELKANTKALVLKIADFIGLEYGSRLRENPRTLDAVLRMSSIEKMKNFNDEFRKKTLILNDSSLMKLPNALRTDKASHLRDKPLTGDFVRKGLVGDWRSHFSIQQLRKMKRRIASKTRGSDVMELWKELHLP